MHKSVQLLIERAGTQASLARLAHVKPQAITKWLARGVPPARVLMLERLTGVSRHELRPDIYPREDAA
jgi:DNA-binding transcriptional regulator YdaS (Cro superfamily)